MTLNDLPGHETAANYVPPIIKEPAPASIMCPKMNGMNTVLAHPTMTPEQCRTRIEQGNECAKGCPVAKELRP